MTRVFSNGPGGDYVTNPFERLLMATSVTRLAAPYFTVAEPLVRAAQTGKAVQLLLGLNAATSPKALKAVSGTPNLSVQYLTRRFHAKIYVFDDAALLGSSNLTDGGLRSNREATICLDQTDDLPSVEEIRALFAELWRDGLPTSATALIRRKRRTRRPPSMSDKTQ
jgi:phosphatidylserine/phosphatidylglycerophosphate/cardiolipin synthase-like enzyme